MQRIQTQFERARINLEYLIIRPTFDSLYSKLRQNSIPLTYFMQNLEIIVLTIIISSLFIVFILGPVFYAHKIQDNSNDVYRPKAESKPNPTIQPSIEAGSILVSSKLPVNTLTPTIKTNLMKNLTLIEILILASCIVIIFFSEYIFIVLKDSNKAIFIGLWPPTILGLLNFFNSKRIKN